MERIKNFFRRKTMPVCIAIAVGVGLFGGFTDYFSPSLWLKADDVIEEEASDASSLVNGENLAPIISAEGAILMNAETGEVIYEKTADKKLYPASTTKIMTTLVALEIMDEVGADMLSEVKVPAEAVGLEGTSIYLKKDEKVTMEELLYGTMLKSGNDAATCVAIVCSGEVGDFVDRMNEKAKKLGCKNTHFMNPSGLTNENHYTTARDLALIGREALKNHRLREIAGAKNWPDEKSAVQSPSSGRSFKNKNKTIGQYDGGTGIKIGYTKASGRTLVASAKRGEVELIAVVLNDSNWFEDAYALMDYGFVRLDVKKG